MNPMPTKIIAEVAGKVWKIEAQPGATLAAEDTILILESMKMEIPVAAPAAGTLRAVLVKEGDAVREGDVVAEMA
jgi:acetyl-CoA carboxylase biotin carboxyl carrier protein